ncbi:hypothetical protein FU139_00665 [Burkholderia territorii]|nr:hypothetical protein FU139_00665 [Burkholderia territorii]
MRHGLPSPWVAGRTAYACRRSAGTPAREKCRNGANPVSATGFPLTEWPACLGAPRRRKVSATNIEPAFLLRRGKQRSRGTSPGGGYVHTGMYIADRVV